MADFEENIKEMVGTTREVAVPGTRPVTRRRRRLVTNEMAAAGGVMYTDQGLEKRRVVTESPATNEMAATGGIMYTSVYITPLVTAVSFVTSHRHRLVAGLV